MSIADIGSALDSLRPCFGPLVVPQQWARVRSVGGRLAGSWSHMIVETRLAPDCDQADIMVALSRQQSQRHGARAEITGWAEGLVQAWSEGRSSLARSPVLWLEYDLPDDRPREPLVSVCTQPDLLEAGWGQPPHSSLQREIAAQALDQLVLGAALVGHGATSADIELRSLGATSRDAPQRGLLDQLERIAAELPRGLGLSHVAPLWPRGERALRLTAYIPQTTVLPWLRAIRWPGDRSTAERLVELASPDWVIVGVQVEVGEAQTRPYIALELPVGVGGRRYAAMCAWLGRAVSAGWCDADKARAVTEWPLQGPEGSLRRDVYLKLAWEPRRARPVVKAYVGAS